MPTLADVFLTSPLLWKSATPPCPSPVARVVPVAPVAVAPGVVRVAGAPSTGQTQPTRTASNNTGLLSLYGAFALATTAAAVYHGYKRNRGSIPWALGWGLFGSAIPIAAAPLIIAEGFGKPEGKK